MMKLRIQRQLPVVTEDSLEWVGTSRRVQAWWLWVKLVKEVWKP